MAVKKVKVGKLMMKDYAAKKPVALGPKGKFISTLDAVKGVSLAAASLAPRALGEEDKVKLTLERQKYEPNYKLAIVDGESYTKKEVMEHIKAGTELGQTMVTAEMIHVEELMRMLGVAAPKKVDTVPKVRPEAIPKEYKWIPKKWWRFFRFGALFCENTTDSITSMAAKYRIRYVHACFKRRGFIIYPLTGTNDVRAKAAAIAKSGRIVYISGVGHGNPDVYTGHGNQPIWRTCTYDPKEVKGKIIHLLSCKTAQKLGYDMVRKGARAYAGYFENFQLMYDQPGTTVNEERLFWICDSTFDLRMCAGDTTGVAASKTIQTFNHAIALVPGTTCASLLTHDRNAFRLYGSKTAKIRPWIFLPFKEMEEAMEEMAAV